MTELPQYDELHVVSDLHIGWKTRLSDPARGSPYQNEIRYRSRAFRELARDRRESLLRRLQATYPDEGLVLYLGAGVSASADFPARGELSSSLINAIADVAKRRRGIEGVQAIVNYNFDDLVDEVIRESGTPCATLAGPADRRTSRALPSYHVHGVLPLRNYARAMHSQKGWRRRRGGFVFSEDQYSEEKVPIGLLLGDATQTENEVCERRDIEPSDPLQSRR